MQKSCIIVAGGEGLRMNSPTPKQFLQLHGKPILMHTIEKFFTTIPSINIILVLNKNHEDDWKEICEKHRFNIKHRIINGGRSRFLSVKNGLKYVDDKNIVAIHDGVRPLISNKLINEVFKHTESNIGVVPGIHLKESIRRIEKEKSFFIERKQLRIIQTPQCFIAAEIKKAYEQNESDLFSDDSSVFEKNGGKIKIISGESSNLKITTKEDLIVARSLLDIK